MTNQLKLWCCCFRFKLGYYSSICCALSIDMVVFTFVLICSVIEAIITERYHSDYILGFYIAILLIHIIWSLVLRCKLESNKNNQTIYRPVSIWRVWRISIITILVHLSVFYIGFIIYLILNYSPDDKGVNNNFTPTRGYYGLAFESIRELI